MSGRRRGPAATLLRCGLRLAEVPYALAVRWRNRRYDRGRAKVHRVGVPVVSVGNLTLGGTGKTPMVEWIARRFRQRQVRVTIVSRGYGAKTGAANDEALELEQKLPDVPHLQDPNRVAAAEVAVEELQCQVIVLDDAFQHRCIHRDLDIVMLDALEPFGFEHVFPRGTLREPPSGLRRAHVVALSRADLLEPAEREAIRRRVERYARDAEWVEVVHAPQALLAADGREEPVPVSSLRDRPVAAFCGIGNPAGFRHTLAALGCQVVDFREFPDHHRYSSDDIESLCRWAGSLAVDMVLCTHKDLVKIRLHDLSGRPLRAVSIGLRVLAGQAALERRLEAVLAVT